jgi:hypothetical protein
MATNFDDFKLAVESLSGGKNTVKLDDLGMPSVMVPFPTLTYADIMAGGTTDKMPGFLIENVEKKMYISKFLNIVVNNRAYSLPMKDPKASITFDAALAACRAKGGNWGLNTFALWAAIMSWCYKNNTIPRGNTNYGSAYNYSYEKGIPTTYDTSTPPKTLHTATGSGPATWNHDLTTTGIADLVGNVAEWLAGMRLVNGEIQVIPYSDALKSSVNMSEASTEWKAILFADGSLVAPGTAGTVKIDGKTASSGLCLNNQIVNSTGATYFSESFETLAVASGSGLTIPAILYGLGLAPIAEYTYAGTVFANNNIAERMPYRGGHYSGTSGAGLGYLHLSAARSSSDGCVGFRSALFE